MVFYEPVFYLQQPVKEVIDERRKLPVVYTVYGLVASYKPHYGNR
jgi:hypothetical protein